MTWLVRNGALRQMGDAARKDSTIRKADTPARPLSLEQIENDHSSLMSSLRPSTPHLDGRAAQLAKYEAAERQQAAIRKADAERDEALGKAPFVLPSEEAKRRADAARVAASQTDPDTETPTSVPFAAPDPVKTAAAHLDAIQAAMDKWSAETTAAIDTFLNRVLDPEPPHEAGVYKPVDGRTKTTLHTVNRKASPPTKVAKADTAPGIDLANLFSGLTPSTPSRR